MRHLERRKTHEKKTAGGKADACGNTAGIFIAAPSLFSTAFAGIKSTFLAIAAGQPVEWNSFLTVTAVLLIFTCFSEDISADMRVHSDLSEMPYMKAFPDPNEMLSQKKKPALSEKWFTGFRKSNISYWH